MHVYRDYNSSQSSVDRLNFKLQVLFIQEGEQVIAYSPALDLSTCGKTIEKAKRRFSEAVNLFFEELIKMGHLEQVLEECGWKKITDKRKKSCWQPPMIIKNISEQFHVQINAC